ncbi:hypothetical protein SCHPADRAFT_946509 [Schizopora paradoxa]|uniref:Protein YAE1 n=1 Tax=Schizopora paradoxa TaxID=27342 RepID=A0A0H2R2G0_9AGAM|nr:hypothetical protein SCHPADRAFT_946509 [Schizopora paradoxa]
MNSPSDEEDWTAGEENAGYREGLDEGKEAALQEGFDEGFARVGGPIGRRLGSLRGYTTGLISVLSSEHVHLVTLPEGGRDLKQELADISRELHDVRFFDLTAASEVELPENKLEELKNAPMMKDFQSNTDTGDAAFEKLRILEERLKSLAVELGLSIRL